MLDSRRSFLKKLIMATIAPWLLPRNGSTVMTCFGFTQEHDAPKFKLEGLPLPVINSDFWFSVRQLANMQDKENERWTTLHGS